jgi:nucleoside-diphosphate-sugar epimerase
MNTLVTGATGFIGSHLVRTLAEAGRPVHALVRNGLDVTAIAEVRPDVVVHLATRFVAEHQPGEVREMIDANVTFATMVAEASLGVGARLVNATSAWQHHGGADYSPVSLYAATKQAFVDVLAHYEAAGLRTAEVCLFDTYGPGDTRHKLVWLLLDAARTGAPLRLGSGRQLIDLTHVDDVVDALILASSGDVDGARLVGRSGLPLTVRELVALVEEVSGRRLAVEWAARPDRPREMYTDWAVAGAETTWRPRVELADGLARLWAAEFA